MRQVSARAAAAREIAPPMNLQPCDEDLFVRFRDRGDASAFEALVERHWGRGLAVARRLVRDEASAEDALQEAFLRVLRAAADFQSGRRFRPWFHVILRHVCLDATRRENRYRGGQAADPSTTPASQDGGQDLLEGLPEADRNILILRIVHELPLADIAATLGCSLDAVRKRAQRALRRLRDLAHVRHLSRGSAVEDDTAAPSTLPRGLPPLVRVQWHGSGSAPG